MADLSDVTAAILDLAVAAVYPNGTGQPSVSSTPVRLFEGWPIADQLDLDLQGKQLDASGAVVSNGVGPIANVSVFPMQGTSQTFQILDKPYQIVPPAYGLTSSVASGVMTITGTPTQGEFVTIVVDGRYGYSRGGATAAEICAALLADVQVDFPSASASGNTLTIPGVESIEVRHGAPATMGQVTHRQRHTIIVTVWAPSNDLRKALGAAIDQKIKANLRLTLPDTSQAICVYDRTIQTDNFETMQVYRRDLYYAVEYATLETWTAHVVTLVTTRWTAQDGVTGSQIGETITTIN
ncbi:hypothetical protein LG047_15375 [Methylocystis sp. WRRC1]|uniref:hypothetical protein n=1 Tax=Methylocystis sp. WRRC1 TaxID=1732014 RepID=UPI001D1418EB|nr:hypothetical protein [Methylocystis sp. WRRC1]MCC3246681.1 hypothetical protein [Methylocystis sp. WRRC1]